MAKRFIGIDWDGRELRIAVLSEEKGGKKLSAVAKAELEEGAELIARLHELLGGAPGFNDHLAAALPASEGFVREMVFPFADRKKISAALKLELSGQLPATAEEWETAPGKPHRLDDERFGVTGAAADRPVVTDFLGAFDDSSAPLEFLDLAPFAYVSGLAGTCPDGLFACADARETTVALVATGQVIDHRLLPTPGEMGAEERARFISREGLSLGRKAKTESAKLCLIGSRAEPALLQHLEDLGVEAFVPDERIDGTPVAAEFLPAVALARRAAAGENAASFNFRQGSLALKNRWSGLKKKLAAAAVLLVASLFCLGVSAYLGYATKARRVQALQKELVQIYRSALPGSGAIIDVPLQMQSALRDLKKKGGLIGAGTPSPLSVLQQLSSLPDDLTVDVERLTYDPEQVRIEGQTTSFDAVNRIARTLEGKEGFGKVAISDAKMSVDGQRVTFRIDIPFEQQEVPHAQ
jgi:general secretion pathway protein L